MLLSGCAANAAARTLSGSQDGEGLMNCRRRSRLCRRTSAGKTRDTIYIDFMEVH